MTVSWTARSEHWTRASQRLVSVHANPTLMVVVVIHAETVHSICSEAVCSGARIVVVILGVP